MDKAGSFKVLARVPDALLVVIALGAFVVGLWLHVYIGSASLWAIFSDSMYAHADFDSFWRSAEALWEGRDIYNTGTLWSNLNPPFLTLLLSPLGLLEPLTAYRVFVPITLLISAGSLVWMAYELRLRAGWSTVAIGMLLLSSPMLDTFRLGQIYPILILGLVAAWIADRHDKPLLSGCALGLVVAVKPSLAPVLLWPLMRRRWEMLGAALASGAAATVVGLIVAGPQATLYWLRLLSVTRADGYWENASLPAVAARLFTENQYVEPVATLPWAVTVANVLGIGAVILTAVKVRRDKDMGLWALVAASLLFSPIAWYRYLVLLGPSILLLLARGSMAPVLLLLALQFIPREWFALWQNAQTAAVALAFTLYFYILVLYWFVLLPTGSREPNSTSEPRRA